MANIPRGIRNNNPGNIEKNSIIWQGTKIAQTDDRFVTFETPEYGIRAMVKVLLTYQRKHGIKTLEGVFNRYAPKEENNTSAYKNYVSDFMARGYREALDFTDYDTMFPLVKAIIRYENGYNPYTDNQIAQGLFMAGIKPKNAVLTVRSEKQQSKHERAGMGAVGLGSLGAVAGTAREFADLNHTLKELSLVAIAILALGCLGFIIYQNRDYLKQTLGDWLGHAVD